MALTGPGDTRPSALGIGGVAGTVSSRADEAEEAGVSTMVAVCGILAAGGTRMEIPPWLSDVMRKQSKDGGEASECGRLAGWLDDWIMRCSAGRIRQWWDGFGGGFGGCLADIILDFDNSANNLQK